MKRIFAFFCIISFLVISCKYTHADLPYLGLVTEENRKPVIPPFQFTDQLGKEITNKTFAGKDYLACFFFISCPTICPKVTAQMHRIYKEIPATEPLMFFSHSIDPRHDSVPRLLKYANDLEIDHERWKFVTGKKEDLFKIAKNYMSIALEDADAPGGFDHSGYILLVDKTGHIRAYCNGTDADDVGKFIDKMHILLNSGQ